MIQQYFDNYLSDEVLSQSAKVWLKTRKNGHISDEKSALIGQLYGGAFRLFSNTQGCEEKDLHPKDMNDFNALFNARLEGLEKQVEKILEKKRVLD